MDFTAYETTFKSFSCSECGGEVRIRRGPGRTAELYRDVPELELHEKFPMPTCESCGETYTPAELEDELQKHLKSAFDRLVWKRLDLLETLTMAAGVVTFASCERCNKPATRIASVPDGEKMWSRIVCDQCHPNAEARALPQADVLRALAALREGKNG